MSLTSRLTAMFSVLLLLAACTSAPLRDVNQKDTCPVTEPEWLLRPEDSAVLDPPANEYYYVNEDQSIWASAWQYGNEEHPLRVDKHGTKMGWFRPAGSTLEITGRRLDGEPPPLEAHAPCCYPTRFQASGVTFPTPGCWEVTAVAADSKLTFIVWVEPELK